MKNKEFTTPDLIFAHAERLAAIYRLLNESIAKAALSPSIRCDISFYQKKINTSLAAIIETIDTLEV